MQIQPQITFRHMEPSPALEAKIRERVDELEQYHTNLTSCRVVIELDHHHHHQGNLYHVRVDLTLPGYELFAGRESPKHQTYEDAYVAVRDVFDSLRRQLEDLARRQRHDVKHHDVPLHGRISELMSDEGYGRITSSDGRDIYFHRNSLVEGDFDKLAVGMEVRFTEEMGEEGPQASSVYMIGKHHVVG
ncbi:MAG: HPF/RaiA family ribosome-associated protein [Chromatiales bacterium]|jgi:ribosomal subunit interface protein